MKQFYLLLAMTFSFAIAHSQTVFTYGNNSVGKDEFLRAYNKNNTPAADKEKALREYLELYSNFKLKVKAAELQRLDTLPQIQYDISNFRRQIAENYMSDEKAAAKLMDEAFERSQKDLRVAHFSVTVPDNAADSAQVYKQISQAEDALQSGDNNYTALAEKYHLKYGDLGYISVFSVPYEYENIIYGLKPGQVSKLYRSKNAWHIFKVTAERKSIGKWKIAQLLFIYPPDAPADVKAATMKKADSVYQLIQHGADFTKLAKEVSDDKLTYMKGGEMPEFGTGRFNPDFEKEVFKLTTDNEVSKPFTSAYGVHIVKRIAYAATPTSRENGGLEFELKQKLMQDSRINTARESFAKSISSLIGFKKSTAVKEVDLSRYADSVSSAAGGPESFPLSNKAIINFKKGSLKGSDWLKFVKDYKSNTEQYKGESNAELWNKYVNISSLEYYKEHLEEYNEDFGYQMKEFKEGNMLFEIMERNVWSKAAADSVGLLNQYNNNKAKYRWAPSADVLIFNCTNENKANEALAVMKKGMNWKEMAENSEATIQADSGRYELSQITEPNFTGTVINNTYSPLVKNSDGTVTFVKYIHVYPADQQRSFEEAKGLVINDYQTVLEKKWLDELHKKYPVKINEAVVTELLKAQH